MMKTAPNFALGPRVPTTLRIQPRSLSVISVNKNTGMQNVITILRGFCIPQQSMCRSDATEAWVRRDLYRDWTLSVREKGDIIYNGGGQFYIDN